MIGIDHDPAQLEKARAIAPSGAELREGDIHALDLADASADRAHTDRVLQHVDPAAVVGELRPGGTAPPVLRLRHAAPCGPRQLTYVRSRQSLVERPGPHPTAASTSAWLTGAIGTVVALRLARALPPQP